MINIVIPMAGLGSRFAKAGYIKPKPFIDVNGIPMIVRVLQNVRYNKDVNYFLIAQKEHLKKEAELVRSIESEFPVTFIPIDGLTEGTACTVLCAKEYIDNNLPLLIANSDQIVEIDINDFIDDCFERGLDGSILCFEDKELNPKWSFAKIDQNGIVLEVKEKEAISKYATVGIYLFTRGSDFVSGAEKMINCNDRVNNEFYTCPVYNYLIKNSKNIGIYNIDFEDMFGLGIPSDLEKYIKHIN